MNEEVPPAWVRMRRFLERYDRIVTGAGVRYGSVIYLGFGQVERTRRAGRNVAIQFPVELEIGADNWVLIEGNQKILNSEFMDARMARMSLKQICIGRALNSLVVAGDLAVLSFSGRLTLEMEVQSEHASGFLIAFEVKNGETWETLDAISLSD